MRNSIPDAVGRRERRAAGYRDRILKAGERLITAKGYDAFSMDELARAVRCTKRTIYAYFPGKRELFLAVVRRTFIDLNDRVEASLGRLDRVAGRQRIISLGKALLEYYQANPDAFSVIADFESRETDFTPGGEAETCYREGERLMLLLKKNLERGIRDGSVRASLPVNATAVLLWSVLSGVIITLARKKPYLEHAHGVKPETLFTEAERLIGRALQPETPGERKRR
jgi:AcrR family transcriptional regulator